MSKTPVREALKQLHSTGLVEINAYQGVGVRRPDNPLVQELYAARCAAEPEAVGLGAVRLGATAPAPAPARQALQDATTLIGSGASDGPGNWSGLKDSALDALLDKGLSTDDRAVRKQAYVDAQRRILENNYWVFLHQAKAPLIHSSDLKGVGLDVDGQWRLERARLGA